MNKNLFFLLLLSPAFIFTAESGVPKDALPAAFHIYSPNLHPSIQGYYAELSHIFPDNPRVIALAHQYAEAKSFKLAVAAGCGTVGIGCILASVVIPGITPLSAFLKPGCCVGGVCALKASMEYHQAAVALPTPVALASAKATLLTGAKKDN